MDCKKCKYFMKNETAVNIRIPKGMMRPHKQYCINGKMKELTYKALGSYGYPSWCPMNQSKKTCIQCGTVIRNEEGDYCSKCR